MRTVLSSILAAGAVALVVAAALGAAPLFVLPVPWGLGLIGVAMLAVVAQPSATRSARNVAKALFALGGVGAVAAWGAWLAGFDRTAAPGGMPDQLDSVVDLGSSTAALALAALMTVAGSAGSPTSERTDAGRPRLNADA